MTLSSFKTIWCLFIKASKSHSTCSVVILNGSKKENPCFHRTISIQIDSPLPQDDTQAVSRQSDVVINNKAPNLIFTLLSVILNGSKGKSLFPQNNFNSDWQSTTPGWHSSSFKTIWCLLNNKASKITLPLSVILMAFKRKSLFPQNNFNSDWQSTTPGWHSSSFKTIWCCIK